MVAARAPVIDLTLLDPSNPRSVAFQFDQIEGPSRSAAAHAARRPPVAAAPDRHGDRREAAHRRRHAGVDDDLDPHHRNRADASLRGDLQRLFSGATSRSRRARSCRHDLRRAPDHDLCVRRRRSPGRGTCCASLPVARERQRVTAAMLDIDPAPVSRREATDFFHNRTTVVEIEEPHETLTVKLAARVTIAPVAADRPRRTPRRGRACAPRPMRARTSVAGLAGPFHLSEPPGARSIRRSATMRARASRRAGRCCAGAEELMRRIKSDFTYEPGATTVTTTPSMSFALRRGVCQDFAHIMISRPARPRAAGRLCERLPAHRAAPRRGAPRRRRRHACLDHGVVRQRRLVGARPDQRADRQRRPRGARVGRDYADVAPIDGVVLASGEQRLTTAVDVIPIEG